MAYRNIVITPTKFFEQTSAQKTQIYRGFSTVGRPISSSKIYDFELIKQDLLNVFNTRKGERVMSPEFGTVIWDMIFEPFTPETKAVIGREVDTILSGDPRFIPTAVEVSEHEYGLILDITIQIVSTSQVENMSFDFDKNKGLTMQ